MFGKTKERELDLIEESQVRRAFLDAIPEPVDLVKKTKVETDHDPFGELKDLIESLSNVKPVEEPEPEPVKFWSEFQGTSYGYIAVMRSNLKEEHYDFEIYYTSPKRIKNVDISVYGDIKKEYHCTGTESDLKFIKNEEQYRIEKFYKSYERCKQSFTVHRKEEN